MGFFNILENDDSNLQTKFSVHITSNIFKIIKFLNHGITPIPPPSRPPNFEGLSYPRGGGKFDFFSLK